LLSSIDYKIKLGHWVDQAKKHIPGMSEADAHVYFLTYKALLEEVDNPLQKANRDVPLNEYQVDVRCFAIFVALQLFASTAAQEQGSAKMLGQDSWGVKESNQSITASPRQKVARSSGKSQSNYQIILHFVRTNMQLFIRLISTDIHNNEVALTANEFNSLRILFKIKSNSLIQA
jgi:hypothetical protein